MHGFRSIQPIALYRKVDDFLCCKYLVEKTYWNQQVRGIHYSYIRLCMKDYIQGRTQFARAFAFALHVFFEIHWVAEPAVKRRLW